MLKEKTVFVLGAGASVPFGFPSGAKLAELICNFFLDNSDRQIKIPGFTLAEIQTFARSLRLSSAYSVDRFLEHRPGDYVLLGKRVLAAILMAFENEPRL